MTYDPTFVPVGLAHRYLKTGERPMRILWKYAPVAATRTVFDTGEIATRVAAGDRGEPAPRRCLSVGPGVLNEMAPGTD